MALIPDFEPFGATFDPTFTGFIAWVRAAMGVPVQALPDDSMWLRWAWNASLGTVNLEIAKAPGPFYLRAVYNLGGDNLVNWAQDAPPPDTFAYPTKNPDGLGYFAFLRKLWKLDNFVAGVVQAASDESTSTTLSVPESLQELTLSQLQNLKTPWGQAYLAIAQEFGGTWGLS